MQKKKQNKKQTPKLWLKIHRKRVANSLTSGSAAWSPSSSPTKLQTPGHDVIFVASMLRSQFHWPTGNLSFSSSVSRHIKAQIIIFGNQCLTSNNVAPKAKQKTIGPAKSVSFMMLPSATFSGCSTVSVFCQIWSKLIPNSASYMKQTMHIYVFLLLCFTDKFSLPLHS